MKRYDKCPKCKLNAVHAATCKVLDEHWAGYEVDQCESESEYMDQPPPPLDANVILLAHICYKCGHILDAEVQ